MLEETKEAGDNQSYLDLDRSEEVPGLNIEEVEAGIANDTDSLIPASKAERIGKMTDPSVLNYCKNIGSMIFLSGMAGAQNAAQGGMIAMRCYVEGVDPLTILNRYYIIKGRLSIKTEVALSEYLARGGVIKWIDMGDTGEKAEAIFSSLSNGESLTFTFTIGMAKQAGLVKPDSAWVKYPGAMLRARLVITALRVIAPSVLGGVPTDVELQEQFPERN